MGAYYNFKHTHLWNDLPIEERTRLHPYLMEAHILHLIQTRNLINDHHTSLIAALTQQINNLEMSLLKSEQEAMGKSAPPTAD